jgi:CubicO group peptidase (beta-lactamase class C family)
MLSWDPEARVLGFRNTYRLYRGDAFRAPHGKARPLGRLSGVVPPVRYEADGQSVGIDEYIRRQRVTGLLILKDGRVAYEYYGQGNTDRTLWTSRSVAKSVVSVLVGIAVQEGFIHDLADPIVRYLPELGGTAWDGVTLHDLMQHTSGTAWNENYADPESDFARLTRCEALPEPYPCVLDLIRSVQRKAGVRPGEVWSYNTGGAWLVGRVLEKATGMTLARYLETRLWSRYPMERDGVWQALVRGEVDMGGHGFNATLRDWGRFALFVQQGGRLPSGETLLPADWLRRSTTWTHARGSITPASPDGQYGFQWWYGGLEPSEHVAPEDAETMRQTFWAEGIYGQAIAINPAQRLVMVQWSAWKEAEPPAAMYEEQVRFFNGAARALRGVPPAADGGARGPESPRP